MGALIEILMADTLPNENSPEKASDLEQELGPGGNLRDAGQGAKKPPVSGANPVGSSGHVPRLEEINPSALNQQSRSLGADADRDAAKGT